MKIQFGPPFVNLTCQARKGEPPAVFYGIQGSVVILWQCLKDANIPFHVEVCISLGLPIGTYSREVAYSEMVDQLTNLYTWNAGVRSGGLVVVVRMTDGFDGAYLVASWLDNVGRVYAEPIDGEEPWKRTALPFAAILECPSARFCKQLQARLSELGLRVSVVA
jgi:hypothetical protein